jgi:hypothetical protein
MAVPLAQVIRIVKRIKELRLREIPPIGSRIHLDDANGKLDLIVTGE